MCLVICDLVSYLSAANLAGPITIMFLCSLACMLYCWLLTLLNQPVGAESDQQVLQEHSVYLWVLTEWVLPSTCSPLIDRCQISVPWQQVVLWFVKLRHLSSEHYSAFLRVALWHNKGYFPAVSFAKNERLASSVCRSHSGFCLCSKTDIHRKVWSHPEPEQLQINSSQRPFFDDILKCKPGGDLYSFYNQF